MYIHFVLYNPLIEARRRSNRLIALLLQPDTKTILVFGENVLETPYQGTRLGPIIYARFTYNGECISSSHIPPMNDLTNILVAPLSYFVPVDQNGQFALRMIFQTRDDAFLGVRLRFDERLNRFTNIDDPASEGSLWINDSNAWWKDTFYGLPSSFEDSPIPVILAYMGTSGMPNLKLLISDTNIHGYDYLLNEDYVITKMSNYLYLLCFDDSDKRPKENGSFFDIGDLELLA